jgi:hypothetical protein
MKKLFSVTAAVALALSSLVLVQPAKANQLEVLGASVTWDASTFFEPTGCSNFNVDYVNGSGIELLLLEFKITSRFGDKLADKAEIGIRSGASGRWAIQICKFALTDGLGPYNVELLIKDYSSNTRTASGSLSFKSRSSTTTPPSSQLPSTQPNASALRAWTMAMPDGTIKLYARGVIGAGKVSFVHNGREIAWVRARSGGDSKVNLAGDGMVRTVRLDRGRNVLEVYVDGQRVVRRVASR